MTVFITGASAGIGEALAKESLRRGMDVVLFARRRERLESLSKLAESMGRRAHIVVGDVTKRADLDRALLEAANLFPQIDIVIANAGFGVVGKVENLTIADYERQFATNVYGVLNTFHAAWPYLQKAKGHFAAIGSVNGYIALPGNSPYAMSKFAVRALCDSLRYECAPKGVSVTHIAPGFVQSEIRKIGNDGRLHERAKDPIPDWIQMPSEKAARQILRAILRRRAEAVITNHGKLFVFWFRHFPSSFRLLLKLAGISARGEAKSN